MTEEIKLYFIPLFSATKIVDDFLAIIGEPTDTNENNLPDYVKEGTCLYAAMMLCEIYEKQAKSLKPYLALRKSAAKYNFAQIDKYKDFTKGQLTREIRNINMLDVRNSFAHGDFKLSDFSFVLYPNIRYSKIKSRKPISVLYVNVIKSLEKELKNRLSKLKENNNFQNEKEKALFYTLHFFLPFTLYKMATYYDKHFDSSLTKQDKEFILASYPYILSVLNLATLTYYQNFIYNNLKPEQEELREKLCVLRNAMEHGGISLCDDAKSFLLVDKDPETGNSTSIKLNIGDLLTECILIKVESLNVYTKKIIKEARNKIQLQSKNLKKDEPENE